MAAQVIENSALTRSAKPYVTLLHERTGAAAHQLVPSYGQVVCLVHRDSSERKAPPRIRELVPAHATASGKALLAWREPWRDSVLSQPLARYTDRTVTDAQKLRSGLQDVRAAGYAVEDGEHQDGVRAIAAPVLVADQAIGALCVSGPALDIGAALPHVERCARDVGDDLGRPK